MKASLLDRITIESGKCGGRPCIRGMRIRVMDVLEMLGDGVEMSEILTDFPELEKEDIFACLQFAARSADVGRPAV
jgi:uncharacterized protein (DUF433 family)